MCLIDKLKNIKDVPDAENVTVSRDVNIQIKMKVKV